MERSLFRYIWRHSRREQVLVLSLILMSLPFYFASLDVPKRIVNLLRDNAFEGMQKAAPLLKIEIKLPDILGGADWVLFPGFVLERIPYVMGLSLIFLTLVLINGAFKLFINVRRGVLGEKLLKQLRYDVFGMLLRFKPEDIRAVKPAEAASIIKDEVEPIGDFGGDAFIQPVFLGMQALTALAFIVVQNAWLGAIALIVVVVQAVLIPILRRRQIILGRERQIASRHLAGRIGALVESAPAIHAHGAAEFSKSGIERQLARLLDIRIALFKRKFSVKYLNNLLAQVTPFFFYSIGGYLAMTGRLDLGQLVAVITAYRDLPPPVKELIDWDQQRTDVLVKYEQVVSQVSNAGLLPLPNGRELQSPENRAIDIQDLKIVDRHGETLLDTMSTRVDYPMHVAVIGPPQGAGEALVRAIGRQITEIKGKISIGGHGIDGMSSEELSRLVCYANAEPGLLPDSIRDNVTLAVRRPAPQAAVPGASVAAAYELQWLDLAALGAKDSADVDDRVISALEATGMMDELYKLGMYGRLGDSIDADTESRLVAARHQIREELQRRRLLRLIEPFHPDRFNTNASLAENFLFGVALNPSWSEGMLARDRHFRRIIDRMELTGALVEVGLRVAETTLEMISGLPPGHALLERYSLIAPQDFESIQKRLEVMRASGTASRLDKGGETAFIELALKYVEARHRFRLVDNELMNRIVEARQTIARELPAQYRSQIEFFDPDRIVRSATVRDNLLFGRMVFGLPATEQQLWDVVRSVLSELGLERTICRIGLDFNVGPGGRLISTQRRAAINLARCLVKQPSILLLDGALSAYGPQEAEQILSRIRERLAGQTLIVTLPESADLRGFHGVLRFKGNKVTPAEQAAAE